MLRTGFEYYTQLQLMINELEKSVSETMYPAIKEEKLEYTADGWADNIQAALETLIRRWDSPLFQAFAARLSRQFVTSTLRYAERQQKRSIGIEIFQNSRQLDDYLQAAVIQNVNLIKSIPQKHLENVGNIVLSGMRTGVMPSYIAEQLEKEVGVTRRRAKFIARDQAAKVNGEIQKQRQIDAGFEYFQWRTVHDERVRDRHRDIANAMTPYGKGIYRWDDLPLSSYGEPIQPGSDYQCFPGHLPVNVFAGVKKLFRHRYRGKLTGFVADDGTRYESTPNHPVLTDRGFIPAQLLNVGDKVVKIRNQAFGVLGGDGNRPDVVFSQLFEAGNLIGVTCKPGTALSGDFHGDIAANEEIDVIAFDWSLPDGFNSATAKRLIEFFLAIANEPIVHSLASGDRNLGPVIQGLLLSTDSRVSCLSKLLAFAGACLSHSYEHAFASIGRLYTVFFKDSGDDVTGDIEFFGDCFNAHFSFEHRINLFKRYVLLVGRYSIGLGDSQAPSADGLADVIRVYSKLAPSSHKSIPLAQEFITVVDKFVSDFDGHVYNLEMENGLFVSQDIAVSNCRCTATPIRNSVVEKNIKEGKVKRK